MSSAPKTKTTQVDQFFTGTEARYDRWRTLLQLAREWEIAAKQQQSESESFRGRVINSLAELTHWEAFYAYPGPALLNVLNERANSGDIAGTVRLARTISTAMITR